MICSPAPDLDRVSLLRLVSGVTGGQLAHRDQGQAEITDPGQQPVQRGLIREQASDDRLRTVAADLEAAEPFRPPVIEDAVDADLVPGGPPRAAHACSSPRLAAIARPAPRRKCGSGRAGHAQWHRSRPPHRPAASLPSLRTAIAIPPVGRCLVSHGTLRTAPWSGRHPTVPVRVESSGEVPGTTVPPGPPVGG